MNRISVTVTALVPLMFALSLVLACPAVAQPPSGIATACTGSACVPQGWLRSAPCRLRVLGPARIPWTAIPSTSLDAARMPWCSSR
ncbi:MULTISPECIES: hypothetical protein [Nocardia]|uniref:hypothetical protein n=1 Tax=Nocardia TaxID=1817 RepID=UPI000D694CC5|nr:MULTISPECIES: hypothetical protein [Nocardia]